MNYDKTIVYDERPGFESYNMMNMSYPVMPNIGYMPNNFNQLENRISNLEKRVSSLENNIKKLQNNVYPQAMEYEQQYSSYQNSMNMM